MATIADLLVKIGADTSDLRKELNATKRQINSAFGQAGMDLSKKVSMGLAGFGAGLAALGVASVKAAADLQSVRTAFTNMLGSAEKASDFLVQMQDFAAKTPFEFSQVTQAGQKFLAFGFTAEQVIPTLTAVGDAAAGVGLGAEGVNRVTLALGQMAAKAKVQSGEMLQLTETGIPAWQMLADKMGVSVAQAMDMVSKGMVDAKTGITALVSGMEETFGGMMAEQSKTILGTWSTMMDGLEQTAAQVGLVIADSLNLTGLFQSVGDTFTTFATTLQTSGFREAFTTAIPPEFQIMLVLIATTLTGIAIPAIYLAVTALIAMAAPFIAAVTAAAPFIAAAVAITTALYALWASGVTVTDILNVLGVDSEKLSGLFNNLKEMGVAVGNALINAFNALEPVFVAIGAVIGVMVYGALQLFGMFINAVLSMANLAVEYITKIINGFNWFAENVNNVIDYISGLLGDMADSILPSWASSGLSTISKFVNKAIGWLTKLISKITETNQALAEAGGEDSSGNKKKFVVPDFSNLGSTKTDADGGGSPNTGGTGKASGGGAKSDSAINEAIRTSKSIEDEWFRTFQTKSGLVERWYQEEIAELDKSKSANENYERDRQRLTELYGQKRLEALAQESAKERELIQQAQSIANDTETARISLFGSDAEQQIVKMQMDMESALDSIEEKYAKLSESFMTMTENEKAVFLAALDEKQVAYEQKGSDQISFDETMYAEKLAKYQAYEDAMTEYYTQNKDIKAEIDQAYDEMSLERLQEVLDAETAMRLNQYEAEKELMDVYQEAYLQAHMTTLDLISSMASTALSGLESAFTSILTGAKSAKQAFSDLGKAMIKTIAQYFSQMLAGMLVTALFGKQQNAKSAAETEAQASAAAGALAPAAWEKLVIDPSAGPVATTILGTGVSAAVGIGMAASSLASQATNAQGASPNKYAQGGYFTRPLVGILGDAGDEVALPLNRSVFESIADGIVDARSDESGGSEITTTFNNYGDINNAADLDDLMNGFNDAVLAGVRGV